MLLRSVKGDETLLQIPIKPFVDIRMDISTPILVLRKNRSNVIHLGANPLSSDSIDIYIPQLEERGVDVYAEEAVTMADGNLDRAIREAISKPMGRIYSSDLEGLVSLSAWGSYIGSLTGLEHCTNLTELWLQKNRISDISPLVNLTNLKKVDLRCNQISDISPLANLTGLIWLDLGYNQISDISPLAQNEGLGAEDVILLYGNPLSEDSINIYVPELKARHVDVRY